MQPVLYGTVRVPSSTQDPARRCFRKPGERAGGLAASPPASHLDVQGDWPRSPCLSHDGEARLKDYAR